MSAEKYEPGTVWNRPAGQIQDYPRTIEAVHYNGNGDDGEDVIVYRGKNGDLGYDRRYRFETGKWQSRMPEWVKGTHYIKNGIKWECVHVYSYGTGVLVHEDAPNPGLLLRVSKADLPFYEEAL